MSSLGRNLIKSCALLCCVTVVAAQQTLTLSNCVQSGSIELCQGPGGTTYPFTRSVAPTTTTVEPVSITEGSPPSSSITAVSGCHMHETQQFCIAGTAEYEIIGAPTGTEELPARYTGCHSHGEEIFCIAPDGSEVEIAPEGAHEEGPDCHFHAGVEHCIGGSEEVTCERVDRDYNVPLRIGLLFVILVTSAIGVFSPILVTSFTKIHTTSIIFVGLKQFGAGVIISTAFVHLFTHASLMFGNECLGELKYEATTAAIVMAGIFISFLVEYIGTRFVLWRRSKRAHSPAPGENVEYERNGDGKTVQDGAQIGPVALSHHGHSTPPGSTTEKLNVLVLEAGIIFHSLLIGLTLVVAGDSFFLTLFAVIVFHQMFEGVALGTCIAALPSSVSWSHKLLMATAFMLVTPVGMAIGIGVLNQFNGSDPSTIIAIGTLDAFSAGILVWVGVVEMLASDWMHGVLLQAPVGKTVVALLCLIAGMALMSLLGKWA
ncbi:Zip-domain-containing protein [Patellaria atrata CBS 101060]|uniref:Zip-domain-containing protein n=1 Tax=Patellaria atrata CBS 101060 TaxID=1346257 RepID=A0A9P4SEG2_9PEZI|nr:Zip-domain-containing protein [Patellaria atrata CBS 101060]